MNPYVVRLPFTHLIKLSVTVDFILVNKCQHDPVTNNGTLKGCNEKRNRQCAMERVIAAISKCQDKKGMQQLLTMPTEVIAVTVLMMVGIGLNLPA